MGLSLRDWLKRKPIARDPMGFPRRFVETKVEIEPNEIEPKDEIDRLLRAAKKVKLDTRIPGRLLSYTRSAVEDGDTSASMSHPGVQPG